MSRKIGEALVEKGIITVSQLRTALNSQLVHGGHLGTCLIEHDYLTEQQLGEVLAEILGVAYAAPSDFVGIPDSVIRLVPPKLVEKVRGVPIKLGGGHLHVAMVNPKDLQAVDELSFASGYKIRAWVAPEVRIVRAMESYYGIPRSRRFLMLSPVISVLEAEARKGTGSTSRDIRPIPPVPDVGVVPRAWASGSLATDLPPGFELPDADPDSRAGPPPHAHDPHEDPTFEPDPVERPENLREVADLLCGAEDKNMIAAAVLDYASKGLPRSILFSVQRLRASVWDWRGVGLAPETADSFDLPVTEEAFFGLLAGSDSFRGPVPENPEHLHFYRELEIEPPAEAFLVPAYLEDRLVAILYGDGGEGAEIAGGVEEYKRLALQLEIALHLLALKRKLLEA